MIAFILELVVYGISITNRITYCLDVYEDIPGIFLVFFGITLWVLFQKSRDGRINPILLVTILLLFFISTAVSKNGPRAFCVHETHTALLVAHGRRLRSDGARVRRCCGHTLRCPHVFLGRLSLEPCRQGRAFRCADLCRR
jgi:hypothetical protein